MATNKFKFWMLICIASFLCSCNSNSTKRDTEKIDINKNETSDKLPNNTTNNRNIIRKVLNIPQDFNYITNLGSIDIIYSQGNYSMEAEGDSALLQYIVTDFDSNLLTINLESDAHMDMNLYGVRSNVKVYISTPDLKCVSICGNGNFETMGTWRSDDITTGVLSNGNMKLGRVECTTFSLQSTASGNISISDLVTEDATLYSRSDANIEVNAHAENMSVLNDGKQHMTISGDIKNLRVKNINDPNLIIKEQ